jgi:hypothetical protein
MSLAEGAAPIPGTSPDLKGLGEEVRDQRRKTGDVPGSWFSVPGSRFSVPDSQFSVPGSWFPVLSSWFSVPGSQFPVLSSQFPVPGSRFSVPGSQFLVLGSWFPVLGSWFSVLWFSVLSPQFLRGTRSASPPSRMMNTVSLEGRVIIKPR